MKVWWSALDTAHTSYEEVKHRRVVAQGWRELGNLEFLIALVPRHRQEFEQIIQLLGDVHYGAAQWWKQDRQSNRTPQVIWNLMSVEAGDIVVGIEGTTVRGACQIPADDPGTYEFQPAWEYAQTIGFPVKWRDWDPAILGPPPKTPSRGILGIRGLGNDGKSVAVAWKKAGF